MKRLPVLSVQTMVNLLTSTHVHKQWFYFALGKHFTTKRFLMNVVFGYSKCLICGKVVRMFLECYSAHLKTSQVSRNIKINISIMLCSCDKVEIPKWQHQCHVKNK